MAHQCQTPTAGPAAPGQQAPRKHHDRRRSHAARFRRRVDPQHRIEQDQSPPFGRKRACGPARLWAIWRGTGVCGRSPGPSPSSRVSARLSAPCLASKSCAPARCAGRRSRFAGLLLCHLSLQLGMPCGHRLESSFGEPTPDRPTMDYPPESNHARRHPQPTPHQPARRRASR